jgi:hypothetical protein
MFGQVRQLGLQGSQRLRRTSGEGRVHGAFLGNYRN